MNRYFGFYSNINQILRNCCIDLITANIQIIPYKNLFLTLSFNILPFKTKTFPWIELISTAHKNSTYSINFWLIFYNLGDSPNDMWVNTAPYISWHEGKVTKSTSTGQRPVFTDEMNNCYVTGNFASGSRGTRLWFSLIINSYKKMYGHNTFITSVLVNF